MTLFGVPITTVTLILAGSGAAAVLLWWSVRLAVRLAVVAAIIVAAATVWLLVTGQSPAEWWPAVQQAAGSLWAQIVAAIPGRLA